MFLKSNAYYFMKDQMSIDISHLCQKLNSEDILPQKQNIISQIIQFAKICINNKQCECINKFYTEINNHDANIVLDSMRLAVYAFCKGGLRDLWLYQQNEDWFPKIVIEEVLKPNDIETLPSTLIIYRGCSVSELIGNKSGQAWSLSYDRAREFAFHHYIDQSWFEKNVRIVLKAKIDIENVYFYQKDKHEEEVVVNQSKLYDIKLYETK